MRKNQLKTKSEQKDQIVSIEWRDGRRDIFRVAQILKQGPLGKKQNKKKLIINKK